MKRWLVIMLVVIAGAIGWAVFSLKSPYKAFEGEEFVTLEHGTGTPALAGELQKAGVIHYGWQFWVERALHPSAKLQAGEYRFSEPASAEAVFNRIVRGDIFYYEVKIPEGSNIFDIARILESAGAMPAEDFIRAASY